MSAAADTLIVDTRSANFWVGANADKPYIATRTSTPTNIEVFKAYGSGLFVGQSGSLVEQYLPKLIDTSTPPGFEFIDTVAIGGPHGLIIPQQSMGSANVTLGNFGGFDGIMGSVHSIPHPVP